MFRATLHTLAVLVLWPTTLFACLVGVAGLAAALEDAFRGSFRTIGLVPLVLAGWFGIITLWRLHYFFLGSASSPPNSHMSWLGLACGTTTSVVFIASTDGALLFFGWPLLAAIFYSILLLRQSAA